MWRIAREFRGGTAAAVVAPMNTRSCLLAALTPLLCLLLLPACAAEEAPPPVIEKPMVAREFTFQVDAGVEAAGLCVPPELTPTSAGYPHCIVLVAEGPPTGVSSAVCERCDTPGQRVPDDDAIAYGIVPASGSDCFCEMIPQPGHPDLDGLASSPPGWYFSSTVGVTGPADEFAKFCGAPNPAVGDGGRDPGASLHFAPFSLGQPGPYVVTVACYAE
jgi:hypothetical protein